MGTGDGDGGRRQGAADGGRRQGAGGRGQGMGAGDGGRRQGAGDGVILCPCTGAVLFLLRPLLCLRDVQFVNNSLFLNDSFY